MKSMADHNNNISRRDNNINCSNSPNHNRYRGSLSSDAKNIIKSSATEPSSSSGFTVNAAGNANRAERCVLCLDEKRSPVRITCGHSFCNECLDVYKSYQKYAWATRCPICRGSLKEKRRSVKRKRSEDNNAITTTTTRIRTSTGRNGGTSHMRMSAVATPVETATETTAAAAADANAVTTVPSETTADVPAEQIYLLEEFMAIASETDVFGLSSDMTFANAGSVSTPTNSVSTVSASEAEQEDMEVEEIEGTVGVDARFAETDFASDLEGEEIEDEVGLEGYEEENDDIDDETDDVYYFNEFDNEHYDDPGNNDYDTVDEEDFGDDDDDEESNEQSQNDDYCAEEQESESEVVVVDEVIIID
ncbi:unnamed protein product [Ceratitis capitata]|uniref:(Mediterranean fruit fly) hypothetical protein n=1 Tax=Ceratitis capitata TaxID=7213 RepID=A0A811VF78_CERCA|nr:unnamed protein product [Ceratitis capitata]